MRVYDAITFTGRGKVALIEVPLSCSCAAPSRPIDHATDNASEARRAALAEADAEYTRTEARLLRGQAAEKLKWAEGRMTAERTTYQGIPEMCERVGLLYVDKTKVNTTGELYMGWLRGTEGVKEHVHTHSWEIIFAVEASGTFTLNGDRKRLEPGQVVMVPPNTKHSWEPNPATMLEAVQVYTPPGPEERFATLASEAKPH